MAQWHHYYRMIGVRFLVLFSLMNPTSNAFYSTRQHQTVPRTVSLLTEDSQIGIEVQGDHPPVRRFQGRMTKSLADNAKSEEQSSTNMRVDGQDISVVVNDGINLSVGGIKPSARLKRPSTTMFDPLELIGPSVGATRSESIGNAAIAVPADVSTTLKEERAIEDRKRIYDATKANAKAQEKENAKDFKTASNNIDEEKKVSGAKAKEASKNKVGEEKKQFEAPSLLEKKAKQEKEHQAAEKSQTAMKVMETAVKTVKQEKKRSVVEAETAEEKKAEEAKKRLDVKAKISVEKTEKNENSQLDSKAQSSAAKKAEELRAKTLEKADQLRAAAMKKAAEELKPVEVPKAMVNAAKNALETKKKLLQIKARADGVTQKKEAQEQEKQQKARVNVVPEKETEKKGKHPEAKSEAAAKEAGKHNEQLAKKVAKENMKSLESKAKEESDKLEVLQMLIQKRKKQQLELDKIETELLHKTNEIKKKKKELLQIEAENKMEIPAADTQRKAEYYTPKEYRSLSLQQKERLKAERANARVIHDEKQDSGRSNPDDAKVTNDNEPHPILGPIVIDLGYKRVHSVSSGQLGTIPIWKKQRIYRSDRARRMADEKADQMNLGFPGIICLYEDAAGKLFVIDGQHRVGMMQALREERNKTKKQKVNQSEAWKDQEFYFRNVLVEVYSELSKSDATNSSSFAEQVYTEINKAEPLMLVDMPGVASKSERKIISDAVKILHHQYNVMFSPSQRCRSPNVNIDNIRNNIFGSNILKRHKELTTGKKLANWLMIQNAALGERYERDTNTQEFVSPKAWKKASKYGFYLGLENSWLYK